MIRPLTLIESATITGRLCYVEFNLFSLLGKRSQGGQTGEFSVFFSSAGKSHAWRGQQLFDLLPVSIGLPSGEELLSVPGEDFKNFLEALAILESDKSLFDIITRELYPQLLLSYNERLDSCFDPSDSALRKTLYRVVGDLNLVLDEAKLIHQSSGQAENPPSDMSEEAESKNQIVTLLRQFLPIRY